MPRGTSNYYTTNWTTDSTDIFFGEAPSRLEPSKIRFTTCCMCGGKYLHLDGTVLSLFGCHCQLDRDKRITSNEDMYYVPRTVRQRPTSMATFTHDTMSPTSAYEEACDSAASSLAAAVDSDIQRSYGVAYNSGDGTEYDTNNSYEQRRAELEVQARIAQNRASEEEAVTQRESSRVSHMERMRELYRRVIG